MALNIYALAVISYDSDRVSKCNSIKYSDKYLQGLLAQKALIILNGSALLA